MDVQFYLMCGRAEALVASHLSPEEFGSYMAVGTRKRSFGRVLFVQVDPTKAGYGFNYDLGRERCQSPEFGLPKRSKYMSIYRVLERIPLEALGALSLVTRDGRVISIESAPYSERAETTDENMYLELCPVGMRVVSALSPVQFCRFMTDPDNPLHVPRLFFADQKLSRKEDGTLADDLPYSQREHILDCLEEIKGEGKITKTVDRHPPLNVLYRTIDRGFFVGDQTNVKFYPFPTQEELEDRYYHWWRSATMA